jgi:predicted enzyme related to lactoylglutathione lyase
MNERLSYDAYVEVGVAVGVVNMDRAIAFYCDHLGFDLLSDEEDPVAGRRTATVSFGNAVLDLIADAERQPRRDGFRIFLTVDDLRPALRSIEAGGGKVLRQMEYGYYCTDPDGNLILLRLREPDPQEISF